MFVGAPVVLTGTIELYENFFLYLDLTESFEAQLDPFTATVNQGNGSVTFGVTDIPVLLANVDRFDFGDLDACFGGEGVEIEVYCGVFDFDMDGDVDPIDWSALQAAFDRQ